MGVDEGKLGVPDHVVGHGLVLLLGEELEQLLLGSRVAAGLHPEVVVEALAHLLVALPGLVEVLVHVHAGEAVELLLAPLLVAPEVELVAIEDLACALVHIELHEVPCLLRPGHVGPVLLAAHFVQEGDALVRRTHGRPYKIHVHLPVLLVRERFGFQIVPLAPLPGHRSGLLGFLRCKNVVAVEERLCILFLPEHRLPLASHEVMEVRVHAG